MRIIFASRNTGKIREARALLADVGVDLLALDSCFKIPDIVEDGKTFYENALKKAQTVALATGEIALGDDSGLMVDFLGGAPGVLSARYAGEHSNDDENIAKLLMSLRGASAGQRGASFVCCLVLYKHADDIMVFEGTLTGEIGLAKIGSDGFGYDPIFYLPQLGQTVAQLSLDEKNKISHRAAAFAALKNYLTDNGA